MENLEFTDYDIALSIGAKAPSGNTIKGLADTENPYIPETNTDFIPPAFLADIIAGFRLNEPIFIFGPTGCAKSESVRWLCSKFHLPLLSVTGHARLEFADLIGHYTVCNGNLSWIDGPLLIAIRHGFTFCFDEVTLCPPEVLVGLHGILDRHPFCVPETAEVVQVHPQFRFIATDNTNGAGDETGLYTGTLLQNQALLNRCFFVKAEFLSEKQELMLLRNHAKNYNIPDDIITNMVKFANNVRSPESQDASLSSSVNTTISVRDLFRWADSINIYAFLKNQGRNVVLHALERAVLFRLTQTDRETLVQLYRAIFNPQESSKEK